MVSSADIPTINLVSLVLAITFSVFQIILFVYLIIVIDPYLLLRLKSGLRITPKKKPTKNIEQLILPTGKTRNKRYYKNI